MMKLGGNPFDDVAEKRHGEIRRLVEQAMEVVEGLKATWAQTQALTKLNEAYMWAGQALRDDQQMRERTACSCCKGAE